MARKRKLKRYTLTRDPKGWRLTVAWSSWAIIWGKGRRRVETVEEHHIDSLFQLRDYVWRDPATLA